MTTDWGKRLVVMAGLMACAIVLTAGASLSQHGTEGSHGGQEASTHDYRAVHRFQTEFERAVGEGKGFGMAFAADQNGYPGPMHVLELRERLRLSPEQARQATALMQAMFAESRPKSARFLDAEGRLRALFAEGRAGEATVRAAVAEVERARSEMRLVHLLTHLKTRDLLTEEQRRIYHEARWGR